MKPTHAYRFEEGSNERAIADELLKFMQGNKEFVCECAPFKSTIGPAETVDFAQQYIAGVAKYDAPVGHTDSDLRQSAYLQRRYGLASSDGTQK